MGKVRRGGGLISDPSSGKMHKMERRHKKKDHPRAREGEKGRLRPVRVPYGTEMVGGTSITRPSQGSKGKSMSTGTEMI